MRIFITTLFLFATLTCFAQQVDPKGDAFFQNKQYKEALEVYKALPNDGSRFGIPFKLGICYQNLSDYDKAIEEYNKVISSTIAPQRFKTLASYNLATAYALKKDSNKALENLKAAITGGGISADLIQQDPDFDNIKSDKRFSEMLQFAKDSELKRLFPCRGIAEATAFGFWVGEWNVYPTVAPNSPPIGTSKVEYFAGECGVLENWYPANGPGGKSFNFYNPQTKKWEQHWMSVHFKGGGSITKYENGEYVDGAMRFTSTLPNPDGTTSQGRFRFFNLGADKVRQLLETSKDGETWVVSYDFTYVRKK
jgi:hypothetical protein